MIEELFEPVFRKAGNRHYSGEDEDEPIKVIQNTVGFCVLSAASFANSFVSKIIVGI